jgi:hypothetical protein
LLGDETVASEVEPELEGRGASSFALDRENKLPRRDALLMTRGAVKRGFDWAALASGFMPALSGPLRSIVMLSSSVVASTEIVSVAGGIKEARRVALLRGRRGLNGREELSHYSNALSC